MQVVENDTASTTSRERSSTLGPDTGRVVNAGRDIRCSRRRDLLGVTSGPRMLDNTLGRTTAFKFHTLNVTNVPFFSRFQTVQVLWGPSPKSPDRRR